MKACILATILLAATPALAEFDPSPPASATQEKGLQAWSRIYEGSAIPGVPTAIPGRVNGFG